MSIDSNDPDFVRHHLPIIFDVPQALAANHIRTNELLNLLSQQLTTLLEQDKRFQGILRRSGIEWGWEQGSWEKGESR